jgi:hypothetical protein
MAQDSNALRSQITLHVIFMTRKGREDIIPVDVKREIHSEIAELAKLRNKSIRQYVNDVLAGHVMTIGYLRKRAAEISRIGANEEGIYMNDKGKGEIAVVTLEKGMPKCSLCKSDFCIHVIMSFSEPLDFQKLLDGAKRKSI